MKPPGVGFGFGFEAVFFCLIALWSVPYSPNETEEAPLANAPNPDGVSSNAAGGVIFNQRDARSTRRDVWDSGCFLLEHPSALTCVFAFASVKSNAKVVSDE